MGDIVGLLGEVCDLAHELRTHRGPDGSLVVAGSEAAVNRCEELVKELVGIRTYEAQLRALLKLGKIKVKGIVRRGVVIECVHEVQNI